MDRPLRIATRGSPLARRQTETVAGMIRAAAPGAAIEMVTITTRGDRLGGPLTELGGKGLFTRELEEALADGRVDLAVHSAKDLPAGMEEGFTIAAVPPRADPRDAVVSAAGALADLPEGAAVGTGSLRRAAQLLALRGDLRIVPIRGNVEGRLKKALGGGASLDAVVLAMAGLQRLGLAASHGRFIHPLEVAQVVPAAGQGVLALQGRHGDLRTAGLLAPLEDPPSRQALEAERRIVRELGASCRSCLAVHLAPRGGRWLGLAMAAHPDGSGMVRLESPGGTADEAAGRLLAELAARGAAALLRE